MADQQINCSDCGDAFVFTQAEQSFYAEKGLTTAPKRCKACRAARKTSQGDRPGGGGGDRGARGFSPSNGRGGGGGGRDGGGSEGGWRPRVQAGAPRGGSAPQAGGGSPGGWDKPRTSGRGPTGPGTPIGGNRWNQGAVPRGDAPRPRVEEVQSRAPRDGFVPRRSQDGRPPRGPERSPEPSREKAPPRERAPKPKFDITCAECGTTSQVPFKPLEGRQVFCQPCYRARKGTTETAVEGVSVSEADTGIVE